MDPERLDIWSRLWLAIVLPWKVLFDARLAAQIDRLRDGRPELGAPPEAPALVPTTPEEPDATPALQLLTILQREGRFIDFLQEDVSAFTDAEIGAAARVVHEGCRRGLQDYLAVQPVRPEAEGEPVVLDRGFDASKIRITGNVVGEPPFRGRLAHHGWVVTRVRLPAVMMGHDPHILAPAEVEL